MPPPGTEGSKNHISYIEKSVLSMKAILKLAITYTTPVFFGYIFAGMAFGLMLENAGYSPFWAFFISLTCYAGSMQFVLVKLLSAAVSLPYVLITTLAVNSRHIFYGLSFIEKFKAMGKRRFYMIFSLTDETYSLLCTVKAPEGVDEKKLFFAMALLNQCYWICGCVAGGLIGTAITFNTAGVEFAMTALFIVIFVEQWLTTKNHAPALIGLTCGLIAILIFGSGGFLLPALISTVGLLLFMGRKKTNPISKKEAADRVSL